MHNYDKVVIFKLGKFYEAYFDDAITVHELLGYEWMWKPSYLMPNVGFHAKSLDRLFLTLT